MLRNTYKKVINFKYALYNHMLLYLSQIMHVMNKYFTGESIQFAHLVYGGCQV